MIKKVVNPVKNGTYWSILRSRRKNHPHPLFGMLNRALFRLMAGVASLAMVSTIALGHGFERAAKSPAASAERFMQLCTNRLALSAEQRSSLRTYLEQEIEYMSVQSANHSAAEVAELIPAEREQLRQVASHLLSADQLRQFRELEATPKMQEYLRQMALSN